MSLQFPLLERSLQFLILEREGVLALLPSQQWICLTMSNVNAVEN
jgi:hypothetical protein